MDDGREKHPICDKCRNLKLPTTYLCGVKCPANPGVWLLHGAFHKKVRKQRKGTEDGGVIQQRTREIAEKAARHAAQTGDAYEKLLAEGARYGSQQDWRRAARTFREAIALRPNDPVPYYNLGAMLNSAGHNVEAAQCFLEAKKRWPVSSEDWAQATAWAFDMLSQEECAEVAKPEWWNDEGIKALSARAVRAAPNEAIVLSMRADVLSGRCCGSGAWEAGPRSAAELKEAATHYERAAALFYAPAAKAFHVSIAASCRSRAEAM